jgi:hypothetical protein
MRWAYAEMYLLAGQHPQGRQADQSMELGPYIGEASTYCLHFIHGSLQKQPLHWSIKARAET